jgi:hypothetical protein
VINVGWDVADINYHDHKSSKKHHHASSKKITKLVQWDDVLVDLDAKEVPFLFTHSTIHNGRHGTVDSEVTSEGRCIDYVDSCERHVDGVMCDYMVFRVG